MPLSTGLTHLHGLLLVPNELDLALHMVSHGLALGECILAKPAHLGNSSFTSMKPNLTSTLTWLTTAKVPSQLSVQK
ncbi:hypothetical protein F2Q70_00031042 [Brassica cretica]|uniref:Uncharacterized protein n=1 Tax=Brassica cretica TaxID=69181 RepID=A0A8S9FLJ9_BRACR|nr:hypothetical protein F2Q70_00031042 [Brassica cretica]